MRHRLVGAAVLLLAVLGAAPVAAAQATPTATVDKTSTTLGDRVLVQGESWAPGTLVHIELCGNSAVDLSADCDLAGASDAGVGQDGHFSMLLTIGRPPSDCPCIVRVTNPSAFSEARIAIAVAGIPNSGQPATPLPDISKMLKVTQVRVTGGNSVASWFGAGSKRTLEFAVANVSNTPVHDPPLSITFGKGNDPTGIVVAPPIGDLNPADVHIMRIPIDIDTLSVGQYTVKGQIAGLGAPLVFRTQTSNYPWGLFILALLAAQGLLLLIRNRVRRRLHGDEEAFEEGTAGQHPAPVETVPAQPVHLVDDGMAAPTSPVETIEVLPVITGADASVDDTGEPDAARSPQPADEEPEPEPVAPEAEPAPQVVPVTDASEPEGVVVAAEGPEIESAETASAPVSSNGTLSPVEPPLGGRHFAAAGMDTKAAEAVARVDSRAAALRAAMSERRHADETALERSLAEAADLLRSAEEQAMRLLDDAEREARALVDRARREAADVLLRPVTPGGTAGPPEGPPPVLDLSEEVRPQHEVHGQSVPGTS